MKDKRFPLLELQGAPYEMGHKHGLELKALVQSAMATFEETMTVPIETVVAHAAESIPYCWQQEPDLMEEVRGIAEGSGFAFEQIFALNASLDMQATAQRFESSGQPDCWASAVGPEATADDRTFVTWTAEDRSSWLNSCVLIRIAPRNGLPCLVWTFAGFVGRPGMNPHLGLSAVCLATTDFGNGLPYPFVCRRALSRKTTPEAIEAITAARRMSGMNYTLGDADGRIATVETSARLHRVVYGTKGWVACTGLTNDGGAPRLESLTDYAEASVPALRLKQIDSLLHTNRGRNTLQDIQQIQRDHGLGDLCAHEGGGWRVPCLSAFICDVKASRMWVTYGNPCEHEYVEYGLRADQDPLEDRHWETRLKDGRTVRIRRARGSDTEPFLRFLAGLSAESRDFMHGWSSASACTREHAESLAARALADDHHALVATDGEPPHERIVGYCWIDGLRSKEVIPMLGIGIIDKYHEVGLGKALFRLMLEHAGTMGWERVRLGVWADNARAIHVYESVGFRTDPAMPAKDFEGRTELYMVVRIRQAKAQQ